MDIAELADIDYVDEERVYRIQSNHVWYRILACCRACATEKLHRWQRDVSFGSPDVLPSWITREEVPGASSQSV